MGDGEEKRKKEERNDEIGEDRKETGRGRSGSESGKRNTTGIRIEIGNKRMRKRKMTCLYKRKQ